MSEVENDGQRLVAALTAAGFRAAAPGRGYVRMVWPGSRNPMGRTFPVPIDDTAPEFAGDLAAVKAALLAEARRGEAARLALDLHAMEADR